jgi:hypothetical protein
MEMFYAAYTKLANVLWTNELQRRFDAGKIPITAMSVHPGNVMSGGLSPFVPRRAHIVIPVYIGRDRRKCQALHVSDVWEADQLGPLAFLHLPARRWVHACMGSGCTSGLRRAR